MHYCSLHRKKMILNTCRLYNCISVLYERHGFQNGKEEITWKGKRLLGVSEASGGGEGGGRGSCGNITLTLGPG